MKNHSIYTWDAHSDQPHVIRDKRAKRALYRRGLVGSIKTLVTTFLLPIIAIRILTQSRTRTAKVIDIFGLCVNIDTPLPEKIPVSNDELWQLTDDLGVENLQIRIPLCDIDNLQSYVELALGFEGKQLLITLLQDRQHIEDESLLRHSLQQIFDALHHRVTYFQIGNAVNRRKWAFVSLDEYLHFFSVAQQLRDQSYPHLRLLGGGIIDFELPNFVRSLFHCHPVTYDGAAALLYVDRRGAPENTQLFCDLNAKINWFYETVRLSSKCSNQLWVTEVNWPLIGTEPFAPATGHCMVDEQYQAAYLVRYFLLAIANGKLEKCYWHQLIAPGYGLIDNRGGHLRKRPAYYSFRTLLQLFNGGCVVSFERGKNQIYRLKIRNQYGLVEAIWTNGTTKNITVDAKWKAYNLLGAPLEPARTNSLRVGDEVIYLLDYDGGK